MNLFIYVLVCLKLKMYCYNKNVLLLWQKDSKAFLEYTDMI